MNQPTKKAVLVDDETHVRTLMASILRSEGFEIVGQCDSGEKASEKILSTDCSLVLLDINMPVRLGSEIVAEVLAEKKVCVIMLSSVRDPIEINKCLDAGAANYLLKGQDIKDIRSTIKSTWEEYYENS